jgi:hypothetical protein
MAPRHGIFTLSAIWSPARWLPFGRPSVAHNADAAANPEMRAGMREYDAILSNHRP